jgi:hypothetical protein
MNSFLLDLWHDLREKRLWPVAALLIVGIATVPIVMLQKGAPAPAAPANTQAQPAADKLPTVTLDQIATTAPSSLSEFKQSQRNPFKPLKDLPKVAKTPKASSAGGSSSDSVSGSSGTGSGSTSSGSGSGSGTGSGSTGGTGSGAGSYVGPKTTYYSYRADVRFGAPDAEKTMKQLPTFTLLGDDKDPAVMFMGITDDRKSAVFTVDTARYEANGEHECKPSADRCEFIYLTADEASNETTITSLDGLKTYNLKVLGIKRVVLDKNAVENVPTENAAPAAKDSGKPTTVDPAPRSLFDILARTAQTR